MASSIAKKTIYHDTYWNNKGKYPELKDRLQALVPVSGEVANADDNPALEKFRIASNCYYDLYNNGLCNRAEQFMDVFGFNGSGELTKAIVKATESMMNRIIRAAAKEQKVSR